MRCRLLQRQVVRKVLQGIAVFMAYRCVNLNAKPPQAAGALIPRKKKL